MNLYKLEIRSLDGWTRIKIGTSFVKEVVEETEKGNAVTVSIIERRIP